MAFNVSEIPAILAVEWRKIERVLRVAARPREKDFIRMAQVVAAGILFMGVVGVVLSYLLPAI